MKQVIALVLASTALISADASAEAPAVRVWDVGANVSEAVVEVHATSETIYQVVTNYAQWASLFSDVREVSLLSGGRRDATVQFESQTLERRVTIRFDNGPGSVQFRLVDGAPGVKATGKFVAEAGRDRSLTRVRGTLFMDASFPATLVVSAKKLAWMRQTKLSRDLDDLRKRFP